MNGKILNVIFRNGHKIVRIIKMKKVYINGYFTKEQIYGVPRYAIEIVKRMDCYFKPGEAELVVPKNAGNIPKLSNIEICTWEDRGSNKEVEGPIWGLLVYGAYVRKRKGLNVNLTNRAEWVKDSITALHDIILLKRYKYSVQLSFRESVKTNFSQFIDKIWFMSKIFIKKCTAQKLVTVSEFSKVELCKHFHFKPCNVNVIGNGWEHINDIKEYDEQKDSRINKKNYFFFIAKLNPHKNLQWVLKEAEIMQKEYFVIAGRLPNNIVEKIKEKKNIIYLGYISDRYMKYLMKNCKALLYPSYIEGFGIPPLESLALGSKAIVSDIPVMHEIYGDSVYYINPDKADIDLNKLLSNRINSAEKVLEEHSWDKAAREWFMIIDSSRK